MDIEKLKFPIGKFETPKDFSSANIEAWIGDIAALSERLKQELNGISEDKLNSPYRPDGWTVRQVVHHLADSHANGIVRTKLALTESNPTIKPYEEAEWATLPDYNLPLEPSMQILSGIHPKVGNIIEIANSCWFRQNIFPPQASEVIFSQNPDSQLRLA